MRTVLMLLALVAAPTLAFVSQPAVAQEAPDVDALLKKIDRNLTFEQRSSHVTMVVESTRRSRTFEMRTWGRGKDQSAIEYLAPSRDKGTRLLRKGDEMWMYLPTVERTQKLSGHMLRQGMMGSDVSYEDMVSASSWREAYTAAWVAEESVEGRVCDKLELTAKDDTVSYPKRIVWLDKVSGIPLKQELYALSGMKLKTWLMSDLQEFPGGRYSPKKMVIIDEVKQGSKTTLTMTELDFDTAIDDTVFTTRWLERGN